MVSRTAYASPPPPSSSYSTSSADALCGAQVPGAGFVERAYMKFGKISGLLGRAKVPASSVPMI